jgi:hypothetical protein
MRGEHRLTSQDNWFFDRGKNDPVTFQPFGVGDVVVACQSCKTPHRVASWEALQRCGACDCSETAISFGPSLYSGGSATARFWPTARVPPGSSGIFRVVGRPTGGGSAVNPPGPPRSPQRGYGWVGWVAGIVICLVLAFLAFILRPDTITWSDVYEDWSVECVNLVSEIDGSLLISLESEMRSVSCSDETATWRISQRGPGPNEDACGDGPVWRVSAGDGFVCAVPTGRIGKCQPVQVHDDETLHLSWDVVNCQSEPNDTWSHVVTITAFYPEGESGSPCADSEGSWGPSLLTYFCTTPVH